MPGYHDTRTIEEPGGGYCSAMAVRTANTHANGHGIAMETTHTIDLASGQAVALVAMDGDKWKVRNNGYRTRRGGAASA